MVPTIVAVPIFGLTRELPSLVKILIESVPRNVSIFLIDDGSKDAKLTEFLKSTQALGRLNLKIIEHKENLGFLKTCNRVFLENSDTDVLIVNSDVIVDHSCFERMQKAAYSDNTISTVSAWTNNGSILSIDVEFDDFELIELQLKKINYKILKNDRLYSSIPVAVGHILYIRRAALNVVGFFDERFGYGYAEEVDFSLRSIEKGFRNVLADDVFVYHKGGVSFDKHPEKLNREKNEKVIPEKYPYFQSLLEDFNPKIIFLRDKFIKAIKFPTLAIDGSCFSYPHSGTSEITIKIIEQLNRQSTFKISVVLDRNISRINLEKLLQFERVSIRFFREDELQKYDFFWRPYQIWEIAKLEWILNASKNFILGIQDLIAFDNPTYHGSYTDWVNYRNIMTLAAQKASACTYISEYSRNRASESGILNPNLNVVIPNGITEPNTRFIQEAQNNPKEKKTRLKVLLIGLDYPHKNYDYGIRLFQKLSSYYSETELHHIGVPIRSENYPMLKNINFFEHGEVSDSKKYEIYAAIDLVFYLSTVEGFGLIPFELSTVNKPVFSSQQGGLNEYLPKEGFYSVDWHLENDLKKINEILDSPEIRNKYIVDLKIMAEKFTWKKNVESHFNLFSEIDRMSGYRRQEGTQSKMQTDVNLSSLRILRYIKIIERLFPAFSMRRKFIKKIMGYKKYV